MHDEEWHFTIVKCHGVSRTYRKTILKNISQKKCENSWRYEKKVVSLHPLTKKGRLAQLV